MSATEPDFKSDENALEIFSKLMAHKLAKKSAEGRSGWQQCSQADLSRMLREHVEKGDAVDVANFCMMLKANGFNIAAAPVPPAGDVEVLGYIVETHGHHYYSSKFMGGYGNTCTELVDRAHVTRLTAERDAMGSKVESMRRKNNELNDTEARLTADLAKALEDLRLEKVASAAMHKQAEDFKALSWERGQDLTKALGLLDEAATAVGEYGDSLIGRCNAEAGAEMLDLERKLRAHQHQSAPAAKGES